MYVLEKNLSKFSKQEIISGLAYLVKTERKVTLHVLRFVNEIASRKIFLEEGYDSLMKYLVEVHKYSERSALRRINAAKVLIQHPEVSAKIESGALKLSQLEKVYQGIQQTMKTGKAISADQTADILAQMEDLNTFESERILAVELDFKPKLFQKVQPQKDGSVRLEITLSAEEYDLLQRVQSYISHAVPSNDIAKAIAYLAKCQIKKTEGKFAPPPNRNHEFGEIGTDSGDPLQSLDTNYRTKRNSSAKGRVNANCAEKLLTHSGSRTTPRAGEAPIRLLHETVANPIAEKVQKAAKEVDQNPTEEQVQNNEELPHTFGKIISSKKIRRKSSKQRKYIRQSIRRSLLKNADHRCSYEDPATNRSCGSRFQLQVDHVVPLSMGGSDEVNNYRILCGKHNRYEAEKWGLLRPSS